MRAHRAPAGPPQKTLDATQLRLTVCLTERRDQREDHASRRLLPCQHREAGPLGLGLEVQQEAVRAFLKGRGWPPMAEFTEVESGKRSDRPALAKALEACRLYKATLVIARMDRLARDAHFLLGLQKAGVDFVACDFPDANRLTVGSWPWWPRMRPSGSAPARRLPWPLRRPVGSRWADSVATPERGRQGEEPGGPADQGEGGVPPGTDHRGASGRRSDQLRGAREGPQRARHHDREGWAMAPDGGRESGRMGG